MRSWIVLLGFALFADPCVQQARAATPSPDIAEEGKVDTLSNQDKAFLRKTEMSNIFQSKLDGLAAQKSSRKDVQLVSKQLGGDQPKAEKLLADLAKSKGFLDLPTKLDDDHQRRWVELSNLEGMAFDRKWSTMMIEEAQNAVDAFTRAKDKADDAQLRTFAAKLLPSLNDHLSTLKALDERLRSGTTG